MASARRWTGLEDFGEDGFRVALDRVAEGYDRAPLSTMGRILIRGVTVELLRNRLGIQEWIRRRPETAGVELPPLLVIAGPPRTGTTLLQALLGLDPSSRGLRRWEAIHPVPRRTRGSPGDSRKRATRHGVRALRWMAPGFETIHPLDLEHSECLALLMNSFRSAYFAGSVGYRDWLEDHPEEHRAAYRYYRRQLRILQMQDPAPGHWVLKSPAHAGSVEALLAELPTARVIVTDRDPVDMVASTCSLAAGMRSLVFEEVRPWEIGPGVLERMAIDRARCRAAESAHPDRVVRVRFADLIADPVEEVGRIYGRFGLDRPDGMVATFRQWFEARPARSAHVYDLTSFGLDERTVAERFAAEPETSGTRESAG